MPARSDQATLRVTQVKSSISHIARNRATLRALGLHGIGSSVEVPANDATRGMVRQVRFLVSVEEVGEAARAAGGADRAAKNPSEDRGDAPASHRSEDSASDGQEKTTS